MNEVEILLHGSCLLLKKLSKKWRSLRRLATSFPIRMRKFHFERFQQASKALFMNRCSEYNTNVVFFKVAIRKDLFFFFSKKRLRYLWIISENGCDKQNYTKYWNSVATLFAQFKLRVTMKCSELEVLVINPI